MPLCFEAQWNAFSNSYKIIGRHHVHRVLVSHSTQKANPQIMHNTHNTVLCQVTQQMQDKKTK